MQLHPVAILVVGLLASPLPGGADSGASDPAPASGLASRVAERGSEEPAAPAVEAAAESGGERRGPWRTLAGDYGRFYSRDRLLRLTGGLAAAAAVANTAADQELYDWVQEGRSTGGDDFAAAADELSEEGALAATLAAAALVGAVLVRDEGTGPLGRWAGRSARGYLVGLPAMYYLQQLVGSGRPGEEGGSDWQPFAETHGVSGHAFLAAVPMLTAARMTPQRPVRWLWVLASVGTAWARVNNEQHYPSQAFLGWYLAWESTAAVAENDSHASAWSAAAVPLPGGGGVAISWRF
ncbi:MAG TPA: phosphatase PAP2 family protein [Thermoanaerobaculia bacterium]|nr:phosphatase PAP2 family protein [Thermoanaerobaculia bacterium]